MTRKVVMFCMAALLTLAAGSAMAADSIKGRLGITGRIGFLVPADSEITAVPGIANVGTDVGFVGGGGFIYGITDNIAAEFDITHTGFGSNTALDFDTTNLSLGVQYRFLNVPIRHFVPYVGAGLDILLNGANEGLSVDDTVGVHLCGGFDYFVMRELALTSEIKGVIAPDADINAGGTKVGNFDPSSFSMTFGVRYFFN
ncbi:MAG TPA: OmpW family outer membrane protein [Geobacteraceae bacterium]